MRLVKIFIPENTFTCCFLSGIRSETASSRAPGSGIREAPDSVIFSCLGDLYRSREFSKKRDGIVKEQNHKNKTKPLGLQLIMLLSQN